jgi:hypothetical protein
MLIPVKETAGPLTFAEKTIRKGGEKIFKKYKLPLNEMQYKNLESLRMNNLLCILRIF